MELELDDDPEECARLDVAGGASHALLPAPGQPPPRATRSAPLSRMSSAVAGPPVSACVLVVHGGGSSSGAPSMSRHRTRGSASSVTDTHVEPSFGYLNAIL